MIQGISFDGLASGLATDEILRGLMEIERAPIRRLERQIEAQQAIRETWQEVNMKLSNMDRELAKLRLSTTFESYSALSSDETVATATATSEAAAGNYHLAINTIARAHRVASDAQTDSTSSLNQRGDIKINGVEITIREGDSLNKIRDKINNAYGVGVTASIISNTLVLESQRTGIKNEMKVEDDNNVLLNLGILSGDPLDNFAFENSVEAKASSNEGDIDHIKSGGTAQVWTSDDPAPQWVDLIFYDRDVSEPDKERWPVRFNRLELYTPQGGEEGSIVDFDVYAWDYVRGEGNLITSVRDNLDDHVIVDFNTIETEHLRIQILNTHDGGVATVRELEVYNQSQGFKNTLVEADDARLTINGIGVQSDDNSIDDAVQGVTFNLNIVGESTITVVRDLETPVETIRNFVDHYNTTMNFITEQLKYDEDTKQAGILQGDATLIRLQYNIRNAIMGNVPLGDAHAYHQLMAIGIQVDRYGYMSLNESRLTSALEQNPDDVQLLFMADNYGATEEREGIDGVAIRLNNRLQAYLQRGGIIQNRDQMYVNMMNRMESRIDDLERRMEMKEQNLRRQFVRLEKVMSDFMSQSEWLEGQIANLVGFNYYNNSNRR